MLKEAAALVTGYLLGSIPSAFIISFLFARQDIRRLGGGNVGILNAYKTLGLIPGLLVVILDLGKATGTVAIAHLLWHLQPLFVMLAGLAAVTGHIWMIFLKFRGGRGMGAAVGAVIALFAFYGYWYGLVAFLMLIILPLIITRNVPFSLFVATLFLSLIAWLVSHSWQATITAIALGLLVGGKFAPVLWRSYIEAGSLRKLIFQGKGRNSL